VGELGTHQVIHIDPLPPGLDQKILIGGKCLNAVSESLDKMLRTRGCGLTRDRLHETERVLAAVMHFAHQQANLLLGRRASASA
jgi:hypothetical protein